ncbi:hypothetical protein UPYG_G00007410 [Umbra pygmaea]|uniref:Uncharacterized protein n=1 Tax=Umbra pygmaea TaxID=75934 RepID=A0ABD0XL08_UMBPY
MGPAPECYGHRGPFGKERGEQAKSPVSCARGTCFCGPLLSSGETSERATQFDNPAIVDDALVASRTLVVGPSLTWRKAKEED